MKQIWITTQFEGWHRWLSAPPSVEFLRSLHRHVFHIKVAIEIRHNDRDIEFIQFKWFIDDCIKRYILAADTGSCEDIADKLATCIRMEYPGRALTIIVSEDGENGCICDY